MRLRASNPSVLARRFAWGFGIAGLLLPLLIEGAWRLEWMDRSVPDWLLEWVIVVWPWSALLGHAEEGSLPFVVLILAIAAVLNVLLYTAIGALVGALVGLATRRR